MTWRTGSANARKENKCLVMFKIKVSVSAYRRTKMCTINCL